MVRFVDILLAVKMLWRGIPPVSQSPVLIGNMRRFNTVFRVMWWWERFSFWNLNEKNNADDAMLLQRQRSSHGSVDHWEHVYTLLSIIRYIISTSRNKRKQYIWGRVQSQQSQLPSRRNTSITSSSTYHPPSQIQLTDGYFDLRYLMIEGWVQERIYYDFLFNCFHQLLSKVLLSQSW